MNYNCSNLHKDWATTGINRATIDKKVDTGSLISLIKSVLFAHDANTKFIYPKIGGIGTFSEILAAKIENHGGRILLDAQIDRLETNEQKITTVITNEGEQIPVEHVFWSGSLMSLRSIGKAPEMVPRLHYMSSIFFNYLTSENIKQGFQWCYFGDKDATVDRISVPRNFNSALIPQGKEGLCVEVSCQENSHEWKDPARFDCVLETFLLKSDLISSLNQIDEYHVEHVHDTYPMYVLNYPRKLKTIFDWVNTTWSNMTLIGRTGRFWYNNMDNSIAAALKTSKMFIRDFQKGDLQHGDTYSAEDRYLEK